MMMMMTTLLLCQRQYMYQFDPEKSKKREQEQTLSEIVGVVKSMVDKDPMKDLVSMVTEEMKQSREHGLQLYQLMFNNFAHNSQAPRQIPKTPHFYQQNSYHQGHGFPFNHAKIV